MKQSVTGHGRAAKSQVQEMVKRLLQLPVVPRQDAADALGMAPQEFVHAHAFALLTAFGEHFALPVRVPGQDLDLVASGRAEYVAEIAVAANPVFDQSDQP